jgi:N-acetylglucosamine malate deacetylase 1
MSVILAIQAIFTMPPLESIALAAPSESVISPPVRLPAHCRRARGEGEIVMFSTGPTKSKVLVLAPHTDDGELGCGGSIAKLIDDGHEVYYAAFSTCVASLPQGYPPDTLRIELLKATGILGIPKQNVMIFDFAVRRMQEHRQDILEILVKIKSELNPDVIFCPALSDLHQDHAVVAHEAVRAFKERTVLLYEMPWNNIIFETRCFIILQEAHLERKLVALRAYKSQQQRTYLTDEMVRALAVVRGTSIKTKYAEAFDVARIRVA